MKAVLRDLSELRGRAAAMPTMWQLLTMILAVIAIGATFSVFTISRVDRVEAKVDSVLSRLSPTVNP